MRNVFTPFRWGGAALLALALLGFGIVVGAYFHYASDLPSVATLRNVRLQVPLRIYTRDGQLVAEFGEKRREPVRYDTIPSRLIEAFLAAEDDRFFAHPGVDYQGILRAAINLVKTGERSQGGSTITMQVARNFFLEPEKTYTRKIKEVLLALRIEGELSKEEILELYLNKIYLGQRAYGIAAAAKIYYGKNLSDLSLAEMAMLAGLPKAPSTLNPAANPERAKIRRDYVLGRMLDLGYITRQEYDEALATPVTVRLQGPGIAVEAPFLAEMARQDLTARLGEEEAYTGGYRIYLTIDGSQQLAADTALREGLIAYDRRHGYRGAEGHVALDDSVTTEALDRMLAERTVAGGNLLPGIVTAIAKGRAWVYIGDGRTVELDAAAVSWAQRYLSESRRGPVPKSVQDVMKVGDVIRVRSNPDGKGWSLAQIPAIEGALVALNPANGAILALSGGFDFGQSKFNRAYQAERQPGSSFKPFVYSAALEMGFSPASIINDAPIVFDDPSLEDTWRPRNYSGEFYGPTRLREALTHSRNLVSIRLVQAIGPDQALEHAARFGFDPAKHPHNLSLALGSGTVTPYEMARGYAVFANGGYRIEPWFIERIEDTAGDVIFRTEPWQVCADRCPAGTKPAERVIPETNAFQMYSMMQDVIRRGTATRALALSRGDIAGKTGTTNDLRDAWFCGFNADVVATVWVGFDQHTPLGPNETGAAAALPIWIDYMRTALQGRPEHPLTPPPGIVTARIAPDTGHILDGERPGSLAEIFTPAQLEQAWQSGPSAGAGESDGRTIPEQLF